MRVLVQVRGMATRGQKGGSGDEIDASEALRVDAHVTVRAVPAAPPTAEASIPRCALGEDLKK